IEPHSHVRYALFGHSLGSVMALETARALQHANTPMPAAILVSGRFPPHAQATRKRFHTMPDAALLDEMRRLGGTPEEILNSKEIIEMLLPVVRDDFRLLETFDSPQLPRVAAPIHVCCGRDDEDSPVALLERWEEVTSASCNITLFEGGHFYINESRDALLHHIDVVMRNVGNHHVLNRSL
ncbi:MAG: alpha/beta fold hydrolase, partial [Desulfovibrio sp.]|uniref:thioesterase II family protein n=1 Tax=Desulfovibrio sp. TaxID=885 RepID=UPI0039E33EBD